MPFEQLQQAKLLDGVRPRGLGCLSVSSIMDMAAS